MRHCCPVGMLDEDPTAFGRREGRDPAGARNEAQDGTQMRMMSDATSLRGDSHARAAGCREQGGSGLVRRVDGVHVRADERRCTDGDGQDARCCNWGQGTRGTVDNLWSWSCSQIREGCYDVETLVIVARFGMGCTDDALRL